MKLKQKLLVAYLRAKLRILSFFSKKKAAESAFDIFCTPFRKSKRKEPGIFKEGETLSFMLEGYTIYGHRWNRTGAKRILIAHGFESSSKNFDKYIGLLVKKGYEVIAFDAPAHGRSSGNRLTLPLYLSTIRKVHELYGPIDGFLAHSYGGLIVSLFLEELRSDRPIKAVFIAPATETNTTLRLFFRFFRLDNDVRKEFERHIFELSGNWPAYYSIRRAVQTVGAEILWFHDEDDELTPLEDALKVQEDNHPNIRFRISKGLGHRRIYRDEHTMREAVDFL
ncbi:MAG: alpha/beta hydrolase [Chitinophagaceae bacterium]|nr:alpha/beta hydrolase [Chitinophagaceae bacterium]